jgi:threonine/homoserine/homoserine lactone efflux protein
MIFKGFRFGMLLQIAVGPVCLLVLQTAIASNFRVAESGVAAVVLVDAAYIFAAILGMGALFNRFPQARSILKYFGAFVLLLFGVSDVLGVFGVNILPGSGSADLAGSGNFFVTMLLLTTSNPLTILFWAGVFSTKLAEEHFTRAQIYSFGAGAVLSTAFFLTGVALLGSLANAYVSSTLIRGLNLAVGLVLIGFGVRLFSKRD